MIVVLLTACYVIFVMNSVRMEMQAAIFVLVYSKLVLYDCDPVVRRGADVL
jgi:hypothetical protein